MLLVHTQEVSVEFEGFPLTVSVDADEFGTTLVIDAAERDDGAVAQRLNFTASREDMRRVLHEALALIEEA